MATLPYRYQLCNKAIKNQNDFIWIIHFWCTVFKCVIQDNDSILIIGLRGLADTGVFSIATYFIAVMEVPQRSINSISTPILAEAWKNKDKKVIENIYKKSVINLLVIALGLFGLIILNMHDVIKFLGKSYVQIEEIVFIMGLAKVLDLGTGLTARS